MTSLSKRRTAESRAEQRIATRLDTLAKHIHAVIESTDALYLDISDEACLHDVIMKLNILHDKYSHGRY